LFGASGRILCDIIKAGVRFRAHHLLGQLEAGRELGRDLFGKSGLLDDWRPCRTREPATMWAGTTSRAENTKRGTQATTPNFPGPVRDRIEELT
jgi:hypothetical protein